jgi:hypothetical protein
MNWILENKLKEKQEYLKKLVESIDHNNGVELTQEYVFEFLLSAIKEFAVIQLVIIEAILSKN